MKNWLMLAFFVLSFSGSALATELCGRISNGPIIVNGRQVVAFQVEQENGSRVAIAVDADMQDQIVDELGKEYCVTGVYDTSGFFVLDDGTPQLHPWSVGYAPQCHWHCCACTGP